MIGGSQGLGAGAIRQIHGHVDKVNTQIGHATATGGFLGQHPFGSCQIPGRGTGNKAVGHMDDGLLQIFVLQIVNRIAVTPDEGDGNEAVLLLAGVVQLLHLDGIQAAGLFHGKGDACVQQIQGYFLHFIMGRKGKDKIWLGFQDHRFIILVDRATVGLCNRRRDLDIIITDTHNASFGKPGQVQGQMPVAHAQQCNFHSFSFGCTGGVCCRYV